MLIAALTVAMIASIVGLVFGYPFFGYLLPDSPFIAGFGISSAFIVIAVPLLSLIFFILRITTNNRVSKTLMTSSWVLWWVALFTFVSCAGYTAKGFNAGKEITKYIPTDFDGDTLVVSFTDNPFKDGMLTVGPNKVFDEELINSDITYSIKKSDSNEFEIIQKNCSRGRNLNEANNLAGNINAEIDITYNDVIIPSHFSLAKGERYRNQHVKYIIKVPEGKFIQMGNGSEEEHWHHLDREYVFYNKNYKRPWMEAGQVWKMTDDGLMLPSYQKVSEDLSYENFKEININGNLNVIIEKGEHYSVGMAGSNRLKRMVDIEQIGERLDIDFDRRGSSLRLHIKCPDMTSLNLTRTEDVRIEGFNFNEFDLVANSRNDIRGEFTAKKLNVDLKNRTKLILEGSCDTMNVSLDDYADMDSDQFKVKKMKLEAKNRNHEISLNVMDTLVYKINPNGEFDLEGTPWTLDLNEVKKEDNIQ